MIGSISRSVAPARHETEALAILRDTERRGLWGAESCSQEDLALLQRLLPPAHDLADAARGFATVYKTEHNEHVDPTMYARQTVEVIAPHLRAQESLMDAAACYDELFRFERRTDIDPTAHARAAYLRIDAALLDCQTRHQACEQYMKNPRDFEKRQSQEKERFETRQAEFKRTLETMNEPPKAGGHVEDHDGWIMLGDVAVKKRSN